MAKLGDEYYNDFLKTKLEKTNLGDYVVLEIASKQYFVNQDLKVALDEALSKFPDKLFHIIKIGATQNNSKSFANNQYGWIF